MTDDTSTSDSIATKTDRIETIITQLEDGEVSLERAQELRDEGESLLEDLEAELDIGESEIVDQS
ncbi:exodeoxyribonuclease VII small subunit [Halosimplex salinum]|uniref:exodeoxyribonuclease VII small subunit n=1 Tax=Halosimplex salinum TaxID=1710538 RepID=UPI000F4972F1|nr:exodeoxyribonuclease VII small subunit [Halosimplex salinum]